MAKSTASQKPLQPSQYFETDILSGYQFFKVFKQKSGSDPERRLMLAVLSDAIECFQKYANAGNRRGQTLYANAESWIKSRDSSWPYSFEYICDVLDINADYLRIGLMQWRIQRDSGNGRRRRIREPLRYQYRVKHHRVRI